MLVDRYVMKSSPDMHSRVVSLSQPTRNMKCAFAYNYTYALQYTCA